MLLLLLLLLLLLYLLLMLLLLLLLILLLLLLVLVLLLLHLLLLLLLLSESRHCAAVVVVRYLPHSVHICCIEDGPCPMCQVRCYVTQQPLHVPGLDPAPPAHVKGAVAVALLLAQQRCEKHELLSCHAAAVGAPAAFLGQQRSQLPLRLAQAQRPEHRALTAEYREHR
ncbi:hypothetical protein B484DRAFT_453090 [Ochromonadaceae sp. CCMP2298]|nr:hypothetical protein B484DRAFT_453090 [Ochromonadaceae sp. CCMP2298]